MAGIYGRSSAGDYNTKSAMDTSMSKYHEYPPSQPFIHDDYRRDVTKPIIAYPESNRQGVMSALKNLQEKMKQIELEKKQAEQRMNGYSVGVGTTVNRGTSTNMSEGNGVGGDMPHASDVHGRLMAQEERCRALERQLERTRLMVQQAETDRAEALRKMATLRSEDLQAESAERRAYADKIADLEREQLRLMATQTLAHNKIQDLEERLEDERRYRLVVQSKPQSLQSEPIDEFEPIVEAEKLSPKPRRRKKRSVSAARSMRPGRGAVGKKYPGSEPPEHYHLNLAEIPFLTGKSTGQSHSLSANFQEVLSLMKSHNSKLCAGPHSHSRAGRRCSHLRALHRAASARACHEQNGTVDDDCDEDSARGSPAPPQEELADLIIQLEDEFGQLTGEHEDLRRQIKNESDQRLRFDLERELDSLVSRMESKGEQIVKLKRLQEQFMRQHDRDGRRSRGRVSARSRPTTSRVQLPNGAGEVRVTTTVSTHGRGPLVSRPGSSCSKAQGSLHLLKDLKKIQSTLRTDDIVWDC